MYDDMLIYPFLFPSVSFLVLGHLARAPYTHSSFLSPAFFLATENGKIHVPWWCCENMLTLLFFTIQVARIG